MVSWFSLLVIAGVAALLAAVSAWYAGLEPRIALTEVTVALGTALAALFVAGLLFLLSLPSDAAPLWRDLAAFALSASPVFAALALRRRGRRSVPRAMILGALGLATVVLWLTLRLKGVRGGWSTGEGAAVIALAAVTVALAVCCGWWSKRATNPQ